MSLFAKLKKGDTTINNSETIYNTSVSPIKYKKHQHIPPLSSTFDLYEIKKFEIASYICEI